MVKNKICFTIQTLLVLSLVWLSSAELWAQNDGGGGSTMRAGLKTGLVSSRLNIAKTSTGDIKMDALCGIFLQFAFDNGLCITMETAYSRIGAANLKGDLFFGLENMNSSTPVLFSDVNIQSVRVPLLLSYSFRSIEGDLQPYISIGGEIGFNVVSKAFNTSTFDNNGSLYTFTTAEKLGGKIKLLDAAAIVGTGFVVTGKYTSYIFDLRYNLGLLNVNNAYSYYVDNKAYTRTFCASFGVSYDF